METVTSAGREKKTLSRAAKSTIAGYWEYFRVQVILFVVLGMLFASLVVGLILAFVVELSPSEPVFWASFATLFVLILVVVLVLLVLVLKPARDINRLIRQLATSKSMGGVDLTVAYKYRSSGYNEVLRYVYQLGENDKLSEIPPPKEEKTTDNILQALDAMQGVGLVVMNAKREMIYHNTIVPTVGNSDGVEVLDLQFDSKGSVYDWLEDLEEKTAVRAERTWRRLAGRMDSQGKREYYDLIASFNSGYEGECVLVVVNQTEEYRPEEDGLNFIAFAAHELRGPITIIKGYLDVLNDEIADDLAPEYRKLFERLIVSSNRLSGYVNNVLSASRYDQRHLQLTLSENRVKDILNSIMDDVRLRASSQQRSLKVDISDDLPTVAADISSLGEVFTNLIDNAIKYSYEGSEVEINAKVDEAYVQVDVVDHGIGMPASVVANLFRKFYRSHRSRETAAGSGIGLYISQAIVESHGGRIIARSEEGSGSTFTVLLPIYSTVEDKIKLGHGGNSEIVKQLYDEQINNHGLKRS